MFSKSTRSQAILSAAFPDGTKVYANTMESANLVLQFLPLRSSYPQTCSSSCCSTTASASPTIPRGQFLKRRTISPNMMPPVKNTFIHYDSSDSDCLPRSLSAPEFSSETSLLVVYHMDNTVEKGTQTTSTQTSEVSSQAEINIGSATSDVATQVEIPLDLAIEDTNANLSEELFTVNPTDKYTAQQPKELDDLEPASVVKAGSEIDSNDENNFDIIAKLQTFPQRPLLPGERFRRLGGRLSSSPWIGYGKILRIGFGRFSDQYRVLNDGCVNDMWFESRFCWPDAGDLKAPD